MSTDQEPRRRTDAERNRTRLLDAAAAIFDRSGVDAPVRDIAAAAGVGLGTLYRHFPSRADLVMGVFRHRVDGFADMAGSSAPETPLSELTRWIEAFVEFLISHHGLAAALRADAEQFQTLREYILDRLLPAFAARLSAAIDAGDIRPDADAFLTMQAIGNLCSGSGSDPRYDVHRAVKMFMAGMRTDTSGR